jgi:chromosome segregation ATPase
MNPTRTPAQVLAESRRRESLAKRTRVLATIAEMLARGEQITFAAVARHAGVSNWLVYADGVREHIEQARIQQAGKNRRQREAGTVISAASRDTDLQLARAEISRLRAERDRLKQALQRQLGHQLDQVSRSNLVERVEELSAHNQRLQHQLEQLQSANSALNERLAETEDELTGARTSLRRMIRNGNLQPPGQ